jgi:hypothetical protein
MEISDRLKSYLAFADVSRRWTSVMDAKGAFISALNGGLLAFLWGSAKIADWDGACKILEHASTILSLLAAMMSIWVITPRERLSALVGKKTRWTNQYRPISFYGYIAKHYGDNEFNRMESDLLKMDDAAFAHEALEQHFWISKIIQSKSEWIFRASILTLLSVFVAGAGMFIKLTTY